MSTRIPRAPAASPPTESLPQRRVYTFVVTGLAAFLVALIVIQQVLRNGTKQPAAEIAQTPAAKIAQTPAATPDYDAARQNADAAERACDEAYEKLRRHWSETQQALRQDLQALRGLAPQPAAPTKPRPTADKNPAWLAAAAELQGLIDRQQKVGSQMTADHPDMQSLAEKLRRAEQKLAGIPEYKNPPTETDAERTAPDPRWQAAIADLQAKARATDQKTQALYVEFAAAQKSCRELQARERKAWEQALKQDAAAAVLTAIANEQVEQAAALQPLAAYLAGFVALVLGAAAAFSIRLAPAEAGAVNVQTVRAPKLVSASRSVSEVTLAVALVGFTAAAVLNESFLADFIQRPLECVAFAWERVLQSLPV